MRILLFDFLNAYPYQRALSAAGLSYELLPHPRAVVERWKEGGVTAALLPLPTVASCPDGLMPWGVGSRGTVQSVLLMGEKPLSSWRSIWTDSRSTASVALLRWLMRIGKLPTLPLETIPSLEPVGRLVIGDEALRLRYIAPYTIDIGELAAQVAGHAVVFAVWWALPEWGPMLEQAWEILWQWPDWVQEAAQRYAFSTETVAEYWAHLQYRFSPSLLRFWAALYAQHRE